MKVIQEFNGLHGATVSRAKLVDLIALAKKDEQNHVAIQLQTILNQYDDKEFTFDIEKPATEVVPASVLHCLEYQDSQDDVNGLGKPVSTDDIYNLVTDLIINTINKVGHLPWQKEWIGSGSDMQAKNYVTKKPYSGINHIFLNFDVVPDPDNAGYSLLVPIEFEQPYYLTFNQIKEAKALLKKGSKGRDVFYYSMIFDFKKGNLEFKTSDSKKWNEFVKKNAISKEDIKLYLKKFPVLKYYIVFRADDCTGLKFPPKPAPKTTTPIEQAQEIIDGYPNPPKFTFVGSDAYYRPATDVVNMPKITAFTKEEFYYSTYFHELVHSTGHSKRLDRGNDTRKRDGSEEDKKAYAFEELVAELGAVFMCSESGILFTTVDNSAKYLKGWNSRLITELENDNRFFMKASAMAQKAVNLILDRNQEEKEVTETIEKPIVAKKDQPLVQPLVKKPTPKKTATPKNKFGKDQVVKVILGDCKNHVGKVLHCNFDEENEVFYYEVEHCKNKEIPESYLVKAPVETVKKEVAKPTPPAPKTTPSNSIVGYMLLDSISGETVASKKTLAELKTVFNGLDENEIGKGTDIFVYEIIKKSGKNTKGKRVNVDWKKPTPPAPKTTPKKEVNNDNTVKNIDIDSIWTDEARFQNRNKLNENVVKQIVANYNPAKFDAIVVWHDKKAHKTFVLAGHHRLEAMERMNKKTIPVKFFDGTEAEAIKYAKVESNANRSLETPQERANIYRDYREKGESKKNVLGMANELEGKNASYILNLSYLNYGGITLSALDQLSETSDKQNASLIEKIADWIGQARRNNEQLTNAHEKEMFDFLQDKEASNRIKTKVEFLQKITAIAGGFDFDNSKPLNLKRFKYKSEGESVYDAEYKELQSKLDALLEYRIDLKDRLKNPNNPKYINPKTLGYNEVLNAFDKQILKINDEVKVLQSKIIELSRQKGNYTNAGSNQIGLFGAKPNPKKALKGFNIISNVIGNVVANGLMMPKNEAWFPQYFQFANKPKEAIKHLMKVKKGDCINALYRADIGYIDIVWGENDKNNKGFGLKHIIEKHGKEIEQFGFKVEDFIPIIVQFGNFKQSKEQDKIELIGDMFKIVVSKVAYNENKKTEKTFVLSAFDLRPMWKKEKSKGLNGTYDGINFKDFPLQNPTLNFPKNKDTKIIPVTNNRKSLAYRMANKGNVEHEYYDIANKEIANFLGKVEKKSKESVAITITGGQGSMKTRFCFQLMNAFAQNYKVGHASIEEHPESALYENKVKQYLNNKALANIEAPEISNINDVHELVKHNDVIIIDSFSKLQEMQRGCELDKDFRKAYDGKLFIIIYQQTTDGKMRGGAKSQFDGDIICFVQKEPNYKDNFIYADKNRYQSKNLEELKYNIFSGKMQKEVSQEPALKAPAKTAIGESPNNSPSAKKFTFQVVEK